MALNIAKASVGKYHDTEVKLHDFADHEKVYFEFLEDLGQLDGVLIATATDSSLNTPNLVASHQASQVAKIQESVDKMLHEGGRIGTALMASQVAGLSPQLYVQLTCQIKLMNNVLNTAVNYFAQRHPQVLGEFRWRVDQKDSKRSNYEDIFEKLSPALLQTMSIRKPFAMVEGFDYSFLAKYIMDAPAYLKDSYGIEIAEKSILNIQKIIRDDIKFIDSKQSIGIQAIDLIVSGLRRCLRHGFTNNSGAAARLGRLMVRAPHRGVPIQLLSFGKQLPSLDAKTSRLVTTMRANSKPMMF